MEIDNLWKAEKWEPEKLMALYKRAGAKYFFAIATHHDNFDCLRFKISRVEFRQRSARRKTSSALWRASPARTGCALA